MVIALPRWWLGTTCTDGRQCGDWRYGARSRARPSVTKGTSRCLKSTAQASCIDGTLTNVVCTAPAPTGSPGSAEPAEPGPDDPVPVPAAACAYEPPDNGSDGKQNDDGSCKSVVTNGNVRQLASGKTCTPECDDGFELSGVMKSSCSAEGQFTRATCLPIDNTKCTVTLPETFIAGSCPNTLLPGEVCQPECEQGYEAIGMTMCSDFGELTMTECVMPTPVLLCDSSEPPKTATWARVRPGVREPWRRGRRVLLGATAGSWFRA